MKKLFALCLALAITVSLVAMLGAPSVAAEGPGPVDLGGALVLKMGNQALLDDFFKWDGIPSGCTNTVENGMLKVVPTATNAIVEITASFNFEMSTYNHYALRYKIEKDTMVNPRVVFYIYNASNAADASAWTSLGLTADGEWHTISAPQYMWGTDKTMSGNTTVIRFDLCCDSYTNGAAAYIDTISVGVSAKAAEGGCNTAYYADEMTNDVVAIKMGDEGVLTNYFNRSGNGGTASVEDGVMKWVLDGSTWWTMPDLSDNMPLALDKYPYMAIRYKTSDLEAPKFIYYAYYNATDAKEYKTEAGTADGEWHTAVFTPSVAEPFNNVVYCMRFDILGSASDTSGTIYVDQIIFATSEAAANAYLNPPAPETQAPATQAPATQVPATQVPATQAPETQAPATQAPAASDDVVVPPEGDSAAALILLAVVAVGSCAVVVKKRH